MTINEYHKYEAAKERQLRDNVLPKRCPTNHAEADFDSFYRNKSNTFNYLYSHNLPPPHPCSLPIQPYPKNYLVSTNVSNDVDIESMTIAEYNLYVTKQDSNFDEILDDLLRIGAENLKRMGQEEVHNSICEQDVDNINGLEKEEAQVDDNDDGNIYDMWDITIEDVERIRKFLTPNVPDEIKEVIQPLIPQPIHTTPPNDDYVAPATKSILKDLLEEFRDEILNVTMVDEEADFSPTKDIEKLEIILAKDPQSHITEIQVHSVIIKPEPFIHTQLMSPLYGVFKSSKSSTKPYKVDRNMTSPKWYDFYSSFSYPVTYLHPNGVYSYFYPHLIPSEGMDKGGVKLVTRTKTSASWEAPHAYL
ncbi:hypothetical protein Tco_0976822 [Tanacetum coccineum]|uniref:Uncharacterized protein n=1 Tax=Tanacetum coccineum TaxID=301880 RepID=A0ABQ5EIC1_9ASTR